MGSRSPCYWIQGSALETERIFPSSPPLCCLCERAALSSVAKPPPPSRCCSPVKWRNAAKRWRRRRNLSSEPPLIRVQERPRFSGQTLDRVHLPGFRFAWLSRRQQLHGPSPPLRHNLLNASAAPPIDPIDPPPSTPAARNTSAGSSLKTLWLLCLRLWVDWCDFTGFPFLLPTSRCWIGTNLLLKPRGRGYDS